MRGGYQPICKMTNADKIRNMPDEELADFIDKVEISACNYCAFHSEIDGCTEKYRECTEGFLEWLKREVKE